MKNNLTNYSGTVTVSLDISVDGDEMETYNFDVDCSGFIETDSGSNEREPISDQSFNFDMSTPQPEWMEVGLRKIIEAKAETYFMSNLDKYEL